MRQISQHRQREVFQYRLRRGGLLPLQSVGARLFGNAALSGRLAQPGLWYAAGRLHPLIHTAEGEFFRQAFRHALERLEIPATGIRERELDDYAQKTFGKAAAEIHKKIDSLGRSLGPPWTKDEKTAALAAAIVLAEN